MTTGKQVYHSSFGMGQIISENGSIAKVSFGGNVIEVSKNELRESINS
ncbi:hypothetical protein HYO65_gp306 [Tenacibaculum phage PTm1]|uniref:Uncharacterized protein n=2 Tax=Shirahamavirus PTm1 TaxID=2846435 RepID=A0A5S9EQW8_9CAUD|nr:hypothetical protein HYO65_gp306 [Tenacibaculum phage PTm1]BBI90698.1 hypothetical protein [Tenacibaculum phage PTm1]BBI91004.1 hypothetical protein [Tenacibaculum phage PTm5]